MTNVNRKGATGKAPKAGPKTKALELTRRSQLLRAGFGGMNQKQSQGRFPVASIQIGKILEKKCWPCPSAGGAAEGAKLFTLGLSQAF